MTKAQKRSSRKRMVMRVGRATKQAPSIIHMMRDDEKIEVPNRALRRKNLSENRHRSGLSSVQINKRKRQTRLVAARRVLTRMKKEIRQFLRRQAG